MREDAPTAASPAPSEALEIYKLVVDEEHFYIGEHHRRLQFYSTIIVSLLLATFLALAQVPDDASWRKAIVVLPSLAVVASLAAIGAGQRSYRRYLITITTRAKLEDELGLTTPNAARSLWPSESNTYPEYTASRSEHKCSVAFVDAHRAGGQQLVVRCFFGGVVLISGALAAFVLFS